LEAKGLDPALEGTWKVKLVNGSKVEVMTPWSLEKIHLKNCDVDTVAEIPYSPKVFTERLAKDIWETMNDNGPLAIHQGEGQGNRTRAGTPHRGIGVGGLNSTPVQPRRSIRLGRDTSTWNESPQETG